MALAEDRGKVDNIVTGSMELLQNIYSGGILSQQHLRHLPPVDVPVDSKQQVYQMPSLDTQRHWIASLPSVRFISRSWSPLLVPT